jgi:hypothetical protein
METKQLNKTQTVPSRPKANFFRRAVLIAGIAALSLATAPKQAVAGQPVTAFGAVKAGARSYGGGTDAGLIAGAEAGASKGGLSAGVTASTVKEKAGMKLEERSAWVAQKLGSKFKAVGYIYEDKFYGATTPTLGVKLAAPAGVSVGVERAKGFVDAYANQAIGGVTFGECLVGWNGKPQLLTLKVVVGGDVIPGLKFLVEVKQNQLLESGKGTFGGRVTFIHGL